ncbi:hypothetical protein BGX30_011169 [Mortierella sp. GBA39]|nr:hypothetical protein BGX30_011169 [Mortierella sp. GBA39]
MLQLPQPRHELQLKSGSSTRNARNHYSKSRHNLHSKSTPRTKLMMFKFVLVASAIAAVSSAAVINGEQFKLITVCTASNFKGACVQFHGILNGCYYLDDYNDAVSSARVDDKNIHCRLFKEGDCTGDNMLIDRPYKNFQDVTFNDMASSFKCWFA